MTDTPPLTQYLVVYRVTDTVRNRITRYVDRVHATSLDEARLKAEQRPVGNPSDTVELLSVKPAS
jgi:nucleotidyltransferase/DNA polymerase involved in DNA repair